jgi:hypothetical protein
LRMACHDLVQRCVHARQSAPAEILGASPCPAASAATLPVSPSASPDHHRD